MSIAYQHSRELSGVFQIATTAAPGVTLGELHRAIIQALTELGAAGPTDDELERARAQTTAQFVYRLQTIGGFGGKSDQLNAYNVFRGDPGSSPPIARATSRPATPRSRRPSGAGSSIAPHVALSVSRAARPAWRSTAPSRCTVS